MSESDVPAGEAGGLSNVSEVPQAPALPSRLRVHALAKLIEVTSRQVLDALEALGEPAKGVQSSIDRDIALRVIESLAADGAPGGEDAGAEPAEHPAQLSASSAEADLPVAPVEMSFSAPPEPEAPASAPALGAAASRPAASDPEPDPEPFGALPLFAAPSFLPPAPPAPVRQPDVADDVTRPAPTEADQDSDADDSGESKRRRRRGRRGRGRGRGADEDTLDGLELDNGDAAKSDGGERADSNGGDAKADAEDKDAGKDTGAGESEDATAGESASGDDSEESGGTAKRRRRRRRRRDSSESDADSAELDDPPNTVTKIREPRSAKPEEDVNQGIQGVRGSTRLEAKRQRRRDGRDAGRRRAPVLTEAEFLARRESVERTMVVRQLGERSEIGVLEDGVLVEHFVTSAGGTSLVGNVYLGRVQNVLPSMEAAFVDIGRGRNAVLYAGEVDWDAAGLAGKARRIEQALSSGDNVLVQVTKDPVGHKGARLTTQISLPGRFLVYVPSGGTHGISRKLPDIERRRLKDLLREIVPDDAGVIIRTASEGVSQEALERDVRRLQAQWDVVKSKADSVTGSGKGRSKAPELLYEEPDLMIKVVRDQFNEDFSKLVVEGDDAWDTLHAYVGHVAPELVDRLHRHVGTADVFTEHRIDEQLAKALDRKVWLPSGGTLVIDRTEAMTVIDVNTGKFTGSGGNLEETVTRNNLEAAEEIVRQLRLRDIGGIIVIDFIDMVLESNRDLVLRRLTECLGRDRTRHQVAEVTSLGLVQMTRKRVGTGLLEAFSTPCEHCRGRGVVVSSYPIEPKVEVSHHGGGRRRGRGDQGDHGGQRNGTSGGARRGNGVEHSVAKQLADVAAASNGRAVTATPEPADQRAAVEAASPAGLAPTPRAVSGGVSAAEPAVSGDVSAAEPAEPVAPAPAEQAEAERAEAERADAAQAVAEQAPAERAAAERAPAERAEAERAPAEQAAAERAPAEQAEAERVTAEHVREVQGSTAEQVTADPVVSGQAATAEVAGPSTLEAPSTDALSAEASSSAASSSAADGTPTPSVEPARPARRRRRSASRPAGPPS